MKRNDIAFIILGYNGYYKMKQILTEFFVYNPHLGYWEKTNVENYLVFKSMKATPEMEGWKVAAR